MSKSFKFKLGDRLKLTSVTFPEDMEPIYGTVIATFMGDWYYLVLDDGSYEIAHLQNLIAVTKEEK